MTNLPICDRPVTPAGDAAAVPAAEPAQDLAHWDGDPDDDPQTVAGPSAGIRVDGWADPAPVPLDELLDGRAGPGRRPR